MRSTLSEVCALTNTRVCSSGRCQNFAAGRRRRCQGCGLSRHVGASVQVAAGPMRKSFSEARPRRRRCRGQGRTNRMHTEIGHVQIVQQQAPVGIRIGTHATHTPSA